MFPIGLYSFYDKLAKAFLPPFPAENDDVAIRTFEHALKQDNRYGQHPQDYWLYRIGLFHQDSGVIEPEKDVVRIHEGVGGPGVPADVSSADKNGLAQFGAWLQHQAALGVDVRKLLGGQ